MRISTTPGGIAVPTLSDAAPPESVEPAAAPVKPAPLQSAVLQPALQAMKAMPEMDQQRIDLLRDALAKGELPFDPAKLAGLIQRFHGSDR
ncbi:MAG: flagellar biosynthesis anti-sigma factor FlgM [Sphingomonadaceae bacterium]